MRIASTSILAASTALSFALAISCSSKPDPAGTGHSQGTQTSGGSETHQGGSAASHGHGATEGPYTPAPLVDEREVHLADIRQLTFEGENAEGYFSADGKKLSYQARLGKTGFECDQIFELDLETGKSRLVSTGKGRTTCSYFHAGDLRILYASTHLGGDACPPEPGHENGYVWPLYPDFDIFSVHTKNPKDLIRLTDTPGYDAEGTYCPANGRIIFTSVRDGDIELYSMNNDGSDVQRLTNKPGYDGGAFYSQDGTQIVWRAGYPETSAELEQYRQLLARGLVRPSKMEIFIADADGSNPKQVTKNGKANFAPFFFPNGKRVLWAANIESPREFHIYAKNTDGGERERITFSSRFNSFPMFSPDGKWLAFASNRNNKKEGDTNLFLARWKD
ncbi:MAG: PD40 domain-containing protein [Planctomycetes bacterium]|nr:PD40 domain-containing protein [Planctomycetota bacterium]